MPMAIVLICQAIVNGAILPSVAIRQTTETYALAAIGFVEFLGVVKKLVPIALDAETILELCLLVRFLAAAISSIPIIKTLGKSTSCGIPNIMYLNIMVNSR